MIYLPIPDVVQFEADIVIRIPAGSIKEFVGVMRRGMAFEHGQSKAMYDLCDQLELLVAQPAATCIEAHQQSDPASVERK